MFGERELWNYRIEMFPVYGGQLSKSAKTLHIMCTPKTLWRKILQNFYDTLGLTSLHQ